MARPPKQRSCPCCPCASSGMEELPTRILGADEVEALHLADILGLRQVEAAARMRISQSTFQRILTRAHRTVAEAAVFGAPLVTAHAWNSTNNQRGGTAMKTCIALVTDDGTTLMPHFGRARYYKIVEVEDGKVVHAELRDKFAHQCGGEEKTDADKENAHASMASGASGCQYVIAGGMGSGAYDALTQAGLTVIQTQETDLAIIVQQFIDGTLINQAGTLTCHKG